MYLKALAIAMVASFGWAQFGIPPTDHPDYWPPGAPTQKDGSQLQHHPAAPTQNVIWPNGSVYHPPPNATTHLSKIHHVGDWPPKLPEYLCEDIPIEDEYRDQMCFDTNMNQTDLHAVRDMVNNITRPELVPDRRDEMLTLGPNDAWLYWHREAILWWCNCSPSENYTITREDVDCAFLNIQKMCGRTGGVIYSRGLGRSWAYSARVDQLRTGHDSVLCPHMCTDFFLYDDGDPPSDRDKHHHHWAGEGNTDIHDNGPELILTRNRFRFHNPGVSFGEWRHWSTDTDPVGFVNEAPDPRRPRPPQDDGSDGAGDWEGENGDWEYGESGDAPPPPPDAVFTYPPYTAGKGPVETTHPPLIWPFPPLATADYDEYPPYTTVAGS